MFLAGTVAGSDEHAFRADLMRELHVQPAIADDERPPRIDAELADRAVHEAALRLAALAGDGVLPHFAVWMVGTIVIRVDACTAGGEHLGEVPVHVVDDRLGEEAAG